MALKDPVGDFEVNQLKIALHDAQSKLNQQASQLEVALRKVDELGREIDYRRGAWEGADKDRNELASRLDIALKALKIIGDGIPGPRLFAVETLQSLDVERHSPLVGDLTPDERRIARETAAQIRAGMQPCERCGGLSGGHLANCPNDGRM